MAEKNAIHTALVVSAATLLLAGAAQVQAAHDRRYPPVDAADEWLYLRSGTTIKRMSASLGPLAADLYWIRALQHYGGTKRKLAAAPPPPPMIAAPEYQLLYPLLDITTSLDPRFKIAYRFGAVFLAEPYPSGLGRPDLAQTLLEKGIRADASRWEYMQDIGFVHYWYNHDYREAARWFQRGADVPGSPWWLRSLAATTLAQGGDRDSSRTMWKSILESADVDFLRTDAERRLAQFNAMDAIDEIQKRLDQYAGRTGAPAQDWASVVRARMIPGVPLDPARVPFVLENGRVKLSEHSPLWPLPEEPSAALPPS
jgi:hypothetical protein